MKKWIILVSACILSITAFGQKRGKMQDKKSPQEKIERQAKRLTDSLALSPDQATKVKVLLLKRQSEMDTLRAKRANGADKKELKGDRKELKAGVDEEMKAILTPEQYTRLQAMKDEHKEDRKEKGKNAHEGHNHGEKRK